MCVRNLFEGVLFANYPSSLPLFAVFPGCSCGFAVGNAWHSCCLNVTFLKVYSVTPDAFEFKKVFAQNGSLAQVRRTGVLQTSFFLTRSALGALGSKSLQFHSRFCVHLSTTSVNTSCNHTFCPLKATCELLRAV